jgi:predicted P-loop ATPase
MSLNQVQFPTSVSSNQTTNSSPTKLEAVANFISQYEAPELTEISEQQTLGFLKQFLEPRVRYNLLTQDVELDGRSLRRHETETLKVEDRIQVLCQTEYQVIFNKLKTFKNCLLDIIGNNHYHPVEKYLEDVQQNCANPANIDNLAQRYLGNKSELSNLLIKKTLIAAVARILEPGCDVHSILVLYSPKQGIGKSSFLKALAKNQA